MRSHPGYLFVPVLLLLTACSGGGSSSNSNTPTLPPVTVTAPAIATSGQPQNLTVTAGQSATFNVVATGTAPLTYQWKKDGADLSGETNASYTIQTTTTQDSGSSFTVTVSNSAGSVTSSAATLTVNPSGGSDTTAPSVPTNLAGIASTQTAINLTWTTSTDDVGVTGYRVYRNGVQVGTSATASYSDTGLTAGTTYAYCVTAYDAAGNASAQCSAVNVTTQAEAVAIEHIYIAQIAQGADSGTSDANAHSVVWFNIASNWSTNTAADGKIGPGDMVHLCGTIKTALTVQDNGEIDQPITILFEPNAKMSAEVWSPNAITASGRSWIVIDGGLNGLIECTKNGTELTYKEDYVFGVRAENASHLVVQNLAIDKLYVRTPGSTTDTLRAGVGINVSGSDITVQHCTLKEADTMIGAGWGSGTSSNITIHGNVIGRCNHGITVGTDQTNAFLKNLVITGNRIDDLDVWNGVSGNHLDGVIIFNESKDYSGSIDGLLVSGNRIGPNIGSINTAGVFVICYKAEQVLNMKIVNNLFTSRPPYYWTNGFIAASGKNALIANNTMIGGSTGISTKHGARSYNNLMYEIGAGLFATDGNGTVGAFDYNVLYFPPPASNFLMVYPTNSNRYYSMDLWRNATGFDLNSSLDKPDIDTLTGVPAATDTVARGHGKNLSEFFTTDFYGNPRPAIGAWTIGAFEY